MIRPVRKELLIVFILSLLVFPAAGQAWSALGSGTNGDVFSIAEFNGEIYVGGDFTMAGGVPANNIARWNGTSWDSVGAGFNGRVWALRQYDGELYAGGSFYSSGSLPVYFIARWDGATWYTLGTGAGTGTDGTVYALQEYNGKLFVGGIFDHGGVIPSPGIAEWNGTSWDSVGSGVGGNYPIVNALGLYDNALVAGGRFTTAGGIPASYIASWNDTNWAPLGPAIGTAVNIQGVYALCEYNSKLYAGGTFDTIGNTAVSFLASWDGTTWDSTGLAANTPVNALAADTVSLYAGGYFIPGHIAKLTNTNWSGLGSGLNSYVMTLALYNGDLFAGGAFTFSGTTQVKRIARWGAPSAIAETTDDENISVFPNPASDLLNIRYTLPASSSDAEMIVWNASGQMVLREHINNKSTGELDVRALSPGLYLLTIRDQDGYFSKQHFIRQ